MHTRTVSLLICLASVGACMMANAAQTPFDTRIREAVGRAIPLVEKSLAEYPRHTSCFSCHHQGVPSLALSLARAHGYAVGSETLSAIARHTKADLRGDLENYRKGVGQPGGVTRAGYALLALQSTGAVHDEVTAAVAGFLIQRDKEQGYWRENSHRPPSEASPFTNTFLAIRALTAYSEPADKAAVAVRIEQARAWLESTPPKETEERVFQVWGLKEAGAGDTAIGKAANELLAEQREDGGWAQLPDAKSDAYATGSALTALLTSGRLKPSDHSCRKAVEYLLQSQQPDGSWHVATRSKPVQPYFESGFPYGKDQFISILATGWCTAALVLVEPGK